MEEKITNDLIYCYQNGTIKEVRIPKYGEVTHHFSDGKLSHVTIKETIK